MKDTFLDIKDRFYLFFGSIILSEVLLELLLYETIYWGSMPFILLFTIFYALVFSLFCGIFSGKVGFVIELLMHIGIGLMYCSQYLYYVCFKTPLQVFSIFSAGKAMEFAGIAMRLLATHFPQACFFFMPVAVLLIWGKRRLPSIGIRNLCIGGAMAVMMFVIALCPLDFTSKNVPVSQYNLYYNDENVPASQKALGVMTTMRLDFKRTVFGFEPKDDLLAIFADADVAEAPPEANVMDIDFEALIAQETDPELLSMHKYFAAQQPTVKNEYTGMFEGYNLIFIVAESFYYPMLEHAELYPTLNRMANEGWNFTNYYLPLFNVSTSDGEYASITGLYPKSGVWSFSRSSNNYLPFVLANQFRKLDYEKVLAFHDHNYTYYDRDKSHPNLGYDYKGVGNGLNVDVVWPESDIQMADATVNEYTNSAPFHVYYLTVSGHLEYNFDGNNMAAKHKAEVAELPYSEPVKAYLAANLEFDRMMEKIISALEESGQLDKTVIAFTADHYPYGLPDAAIDELVGHPVERTFELYKNGFVIWSPALEHRNIGCLMSSLDILPTLSNLFGLEYDSRLLMGHDVFSGAEPLVAFNDRSWITEKGRYDANSQTASEGLPEAYVNSINSLVHSKFVYSGKVLDKNYYSVVLK